MSIVVSDLSFAYPGDDDLFFDVSFKVGPGEHWGLVGENGSGKTTLLRVLAGELAPATGDVRMGGDVLYLPQDIGFATERTVREMLLGFASPQLRAAGQRLAEAERRLADGDPEAGLAVGEAIGEWSELQGYALEGRWDASTRRILGVGLEEATDRPVTTLSGGELQAPGPRRPLRVRRRRSCSSTSPTTTWTSRPRPGWRASSGSRPRPS